MTGLRSPLDFVGDEVHRGRTSAPCANRTCLRVSPAPARVGRTRLRLPPVRRRRTGEAAGLAFPASRGDPSPVVAGVGALRERASYNAVRARVRRRGPGPGSAFPDMAPAPGQRSPTRARLRVGVR